jgi:hypothetical protein
VTEAPADIQPAPEPDHQPAVAPPAKSVTEARDTALKTASAATAETRPPEQPRLSSRRRYVIWGLPLGLAGFLAALVWLQFTALAQMPVLRPAFEWLCPHIGCSLPPPRALNRVTAHDLTVAPAPDHPGRVEVRLLLVNGAEFEQAFPKLRLRFTNAAGERIIDHTFLPPDYLAPEDRLFQALPSRLPVQVLLDVPDPGPAAVNYALELH